MIYLQKSLALCYKLAMEKTYDPQGIEQRWYQQWEDDKCFAPSGEGAPYCMMIPPPNVTGRLHMGHGFQHALMDALIRYHRMCGDNTLWQMGTDHAGIATQMVVERQLLKAGQSRHEIGRETFIEKVWEWKQTSGNTMSEQIRRLGSSVDWDTERFTMDEDLSRAVSEVFIRLYDEGLIYRGKRLVNWDTVLQTAISDLEVVTQEEQGHLWHIRFPLVNPTDACDALIVATTRPETMLGDVAVAVHPEDRRYQSLIGQSVHLPLSDRKIPIIADEYVDKEFGTGCVKITPAHDFNDYAIGQRHDLPLINVLTPDGKINENAPDVYQGLDRFVARKKVVADLESQKLLEKTEPHTLNIPRGDRSHTIIEPYLTDQWFVKVGPLAEPAIEAVKSGQISFFPPNWVNTYYRWLEDVEDWCISRQLWWGHRVPAWYDDQGKIYVGADEAAVRAKYQLANDLVLTQDEDVLDTWFSSALWPFSTLGWPAETERLKNFYPTSVLVTGFDIIFFWVARMVMMGLKFTGQIPFKHVYITGLIRDAHGQKMSKSKGNVLDPIDLVDGISLEDLLEKRTGHLMQPEMVNKIAKQTREDFPEGIAAHGTDALRFTFCALAATGRDIRFDLNRLAGYRNFCNKLWNAARYVLMQVENQDLPMMQAPPQAQALGLVDRWIISELQIVIEKAHEHFDQYRFDLLASTLYEFTWNTFCDWYLELSKPILMGSHQSAANNTRYTLVYVLEVLLRLMHPIIPFITEEIWQRVAPLRGITAKTMMKQPYPVVEKSLLDVAASSEVHWMQNLIIGVRTIRAEMNISPGKAVPLLLRKGQKLDKARIQRNEPFLMMLMKLEKIDWLDEKDTPPAAATALVGDLELLIPMADLIDKEAECARLQKEIDKLQKQLDASQGRLNNPRYVEKAPAAVVAQERERVEQFAAALEKLRQQHALIKG